MDKKAKILFYSSNCEIVGGNAKYLFDLINNLDSDKYEIELFADRNYLFDKRAHQYSLKNAPINYLDTKPVLFQKNFVQRLYGRVKKNNSKAGIKLLSFLDYDLFGYSIYKWFNFIFTKLYRLLTLTSFRYYFHNLAIFYWLFKGNPRGIDIFHFNNGGYPGPGSRILTFLLANLSGINKTVMTVHNLPGYRKWWSIMDYILDIATFRYCKKIIIPSKKLKLEMNRRRKYPLNRISAIYCGLEDADILSKEEILNKKKELNLKSDAPILLIAGALDEYRKGHKVLLKALIKVKKDCPEVVLLIVGDGEKRGELAELSKKYHIENNVVFLGYREDINEINNIADIAIVPSIGFEAVPYTIKEALRAAVPVITTDAGGCDEGVIDGLNGLVVCQGCVSELAQAIFKMLGNDKLRSKMGKAGRDYFLKEFVLSEKIRMHEDIYKTLL